MANLGTLSLDIVAKIGGFIAGLNQAERASAKSAKEIERNLQRLNVSAIAVGNALGEFLADGIRAAANAFPALIQNAAQFQDLAEMTGGSAEGLASMAVAAGTAGVSMESVASASNKLTKNLIGVDDESKATGAALKALNIELDTFKRLSPEERVDTLTEAFASFADGTGKTAVAMALWGKSGAEQLKLMKALEEQGGRSNILTKEQIKLADDFADRNAKLRAELGLYAAGITAETLPALNELIKYTLLAGKEILGLTGEASSLGKNTGVREFAQNAAVAISGFIDGVGNAVAAVGTLINAAQLFGTNARLAFEVVATPHSGFSNLIQGKGYFDNVKKAYAENEAQAEKLSKSFTATLDRAKGREGKSLRELFDQQNLIDKDKRNLFTAKDPRRLDVKPELVFEGGVKPPKKPKPPKAGGGGAADDPTKKLLENELANFKAAGDQAKEQLADRNKMLDLYNQQGLLSVQDYYAGVKSATDEATAAQAKSFDDQIAALEKFKAAAKQDTDVADTQGKINKLTEEKAKLYRQAGIEAIAMKVKEEQAAKAVKAAFDEVNAKVLEFQGNMRAAAEIRFDASNEKLIAQARAENNDVILKQIELLKQLELAQADINKAQQQFALAQGDLQIAEERITIARERGTMGEIESLRASGVARQQAVALMEKHLATLLAINDAARSPEQVQAIERLKVQLEGLKATIDPLADKFNTMFSDAAGSAFTDFINGTKTAKEAFKSFTDSIFKQLTDLIVKDLFKQLFSSSGGGTGFNVGKMLSDFFGGASGGMFGAAKGATAQPAANAAAGGEDVLGAFISKLGTGDVAATSAAASSTALATSATAASAAISAMAAAASAAATALAAAAATSSSSSLGSLASSLAGANAVGSSGGDALGALIKLQGWSSGGYTGMGAANEPAGFVHKREYVFDEKTTQRLGVSNLNRIKGGGSLGFSPVNNFVVPGNIDHRTVFANPVDSGRNIGKMLSDLFRWASGGGVTAAKVASEASEKSAIGEGGPGRLHRETSSTAFAASTPAPAIAALAAAVSSAATAIAAAAAATSSSSALGSLASSMSSANAIGASGVDSLMALILSRGWASGGFTGTGAANDPAGIVHKGEYVLDQATTKRLGVDRLNRLNSGGSAGFSQVKNFAVQGQIDYRTVFAPAWNSGFNIGKMLSAIFGVASGGGGVAAAAKVAAETSAKSAIGDDVLGEFIGKLGTGDADATIAAASRTALSTSATAASLDISALASAAASTAAAMRSILATSGGIGDLGGVASRTGNSGIMASFLNGVAEAVASLAASNAALPEIATITDITALASAAATGRTSSLGSLASSMAGVNAVGSSGGLGIFGGASGGVAAAAKEKSAGGENVLGDFIGKIGIGDAATSAAASSTAFAARLAATTTTIAALVAAAAPISSSALARSSLASASAIGASGGHVLDELLTLRGWSSGGFTGMGAANDPAGIVHRGEYVLDANTTKRLGVNYLDGINNGGSTGGTNVVINQQFAAGTSRETTNQAALAASRVISRSQRNA